MLASASASYAQDAANPESGAVANPADEDNAIVVTGSRVARTGFENPTPTTVVSAEQIANSGLNDIGDILLQSPQISVGLGASNDTFERDIGATFVNLRGLGTNRTLVLVDGRRRVSGSRDGSQVDVSAIPASMIESVEIITGGASAVYGADAVSGVVNIILKDDMDGLTASGRYGLSSRGDADTYMLSLAGGGSFADGRGSARLGVTYNKSEMLKYTARDYVYEDRATWVANPANTGPDDGIADRIPASPFFSSNIAYDPSFVIGGQRYYYDDATLIPQYATNCYGTVCTDGDYGYTGRERNLRNPRETFAAIAGIEYEVSDAVTAFADFEFSFADTDTNGQSFFDSSLVLQRDNPFIPDEVAALMDANGLSTLTIGYEGEEIFGNKGYTNSRYTYSVSGGFRGALTDRLDWEAFAQYGRRDQDYKISNTRIESRFFEAVDAVVDPASGNVVCRSATAQAAGCVPIDLFSGALTDDELAYFQYTFLRNVTNEQVLAGAQITGSLFDLPAGPVGVAVGAEYRKDKLATLDDGLGARGLLYRTDNGGLSVNASTEVTEAFAEVVVPVLRDSFIGSLDVEGAARFSHYDTIGSTLAWKLGADWAPIDDLRFRVTRSRSVRAPNIVELFAPETGGTLNIAADPCDVSSISLAPNREANCRALGVPEGWVDPAAALALTTRLGGNPDLTEETSNSWTAGVVASPVAGLRLSADWWSIKIDDAIQTIDGNSIVDNCVDSDTLDNPFCALVTRGGFVGIDDPYVISQIDLRQVNVGALTARGIDFAASYSTYLDSISSGLDGRVMLRATVTYLDKLEELVDVDDPSSLLISDGEFGDPTWRGNGSIAYENGGLNVFWNIRYVGPSDIDVQRTDEYYGGIRVDERFYHDVSVSYEFDNDLTLQAGVNNLFDEAPPVTPSTYTGAFDGSLFDNIGRFFFVGFSLGL